MILSLIFSVSAVAQQRKPSRLPAQTSSVSSTITKPRPARSGSQKGIVVVERADIYRDADFDSPVVGSVKKGQVFDISRYPIGPFYKIRLKPGVLGWVSDIDIKPTQKVPALSAPAAAPAVTASPSKTPPKAEPKTESQEMAGMKIKKPAEDTERDSLSKKPFLVRRYRGLAYEMIRWTEDTMGTTRSENLNFFGVNWSGYNTAISGEIYTDSSILIATTAPTYYETLTGHSAGGWIMKMNFAFQTASPQGPSHLLYYGFGPSLTYSHFDVALTEAGKKVSYSLDDIGAGLVFNVGLAFKFGSLSPRLAFKYYWEKKQMTAGALSLGWEF